MELVKKLSKKVTCQEQYDYMVEVGKTAYDIEAKNVNYKSILKKEAQLCEVK